MRQLKIISTALVALLFTTILSAGIEVSPILIDIQGNELDKKDVRVYNNGTTTEYVKVTPFQVGNPGTDKQKLNSISDPEALGLLVSPRVMVIPPKQSRNIRLVLLKTNIKTDHVYQIDVQPTAGQLTLNKSKNENVGIRVVVGYGIIIIQRPGNSDGSAVGGVKLDISGKIKRDGNNLTITNNGNSNFLLVNGSQCDAKKANCKELPVKRLYAGQSWTVTVPYTTPVTYTMSYLETGKSLVSN